ncbi:hypothetical protein HY605_02645 [Candidatus Peregrinibacteria bacterium]|nr:hypothetical protein [Candidatus Peregrinibacteria bacterium]
MRKTIFSLLTLAILTACSSNNQNSDQINADTVLDDKIFAQATANQNLSMCDEILAADRKEECIQIIEDSFKMQEALRELDLSKCDEIDFDRYKDSCQASVKEALGEGEAKALEKEKEAEDMSSVQAALDKSDPDLCDKAENDEVKFTCKYNILVSKAIDEKDSSLCEEIGYEPYEADCKSAVAEAN